MFVAPVYWDINSLSTFRNFDLLSNSSFLVQSSCFLLAPPFLVSVSFAQSCFLCFLCSPTRPLLTASPTTVSEWEEVGAEQRAGISTPITITSSGVLNEVTHSSVAGANHCSLLPKHSDNDRQRGGFSCLETLNLTQAQTVHVETHMAVDGESDEKVSDTRSSIKRDTHMSFPLANRLPGCMETGRRCADLSTAALSLLYDPLHHHIQAVNLSSNAHATADMWIPSSDFNWAHIQRRCWSSRRGMRS